MMVSVVIIAEDTLVKVIAPHKSYASPERLPSAAVVSSKLDINTLQMLRFQTCRRFGEESPCWREKLRVRAPATIRAAACAGAPCEIDSFRKSGVARIVAGTLSHDQTVSRAPPLTAPEQEHRSP